MARPLYGHWVAIGASFTWTLSCQWHVLDTGKCSAVSKFFKKVMCFEIFFFVSGVVKKKFGFVLLFCFSSENERDIVVILVPRYISMKMTHKHVIWQKNGHIIKLNINLTFWTILTYGTSNGL
jgi:hypothetical protein